MDVIGMILSEANMRKAVDRVKRNRGAPGVDGMPVDELPGYFAEHGEEIKASIRNGTYKPSPIRRVCMPKPNGEKRPLGIPTAIDRVVQQAVAQVLTHIFDDTFSEHSHGFRPGRSAHGAMAECLGYLEEGYAWVVDIDIRRFFDTVNHDRLISILRMRMNDARTLRLIRSFLRSGVMENGLATESEEGVPQGSPLSPILSNICLDRLGKELEGRGLKFVRYADDCNMFVKSRRAAERVLASVSAWLERRLCLRANEEKSMAVPANKSQFLGFRFWKRSNGWRLRVDEKRKQRLKDKVKEITKRNKAVARPLAFTFIKLNQTARGWINYFSIACMKTFMGEFGGWMRHKARVAILKQWKKPRTIYRNLMALNKRFGCGMGDNEIYKVANSRLGLYRSAGYDTVNYLLSPKVLAMPKEDRPGLVNPLEYYLGRFVNK